MSRVETYKCDICGIHKEKANHWFHGHVLEGSPILIPWGTGFMVGGQITKCETMMEWPDNNLRPRAYLEVPKLPPLVIPTSFTESNAVAHLCGIQHAIEWASKVLSKPVAKAPEV